MVLKNRQQPLGLAPGPVPHSLPRDPDGYVSGQQRVRIPVAIALERLAVPGDASTPIVQWIAPWRTRPERLSLVKY